MTKHSEKPETATCDNNVLQVVFLAPYLPYGLNVFTDAFSTENKIYKMVFKNETVSYRGGIEVNDVINYCKPILKPLTDITEEEYVILDGCHNFSSMRFSDLEKDPTRYPYTIVQKLIEWHYDVFGLIEKGLAISVHDVE